MRSKDTETLVNRKSTKPIPVYYRTQPRRHERVSERKTMGLIEAQTGVNDPTEGELNQIRRGTYVQVAVAGARYWVKVVKVQRENGTFAGEIEGDPALVFFKKCHVMAII